jgi:hypothetical protein
MLVAQLAENLRWWHRGGDPTVGGSSKATFSESILVVHAGPEKEDQVAG